MRPILYTVSQKTNNVGVPQTGNSADHIQKILFFCERECHHINPFHSQNLVQKINVFRFLLRVHLQSNMGIILKSKLVILIRVCSLYLAIRKFSFIDRTKRSLSKKVFFAVHVSGGFKLCHSVSFCFSWETGSLRETSAISPLSSSTTSRTGTIRTANYDWRTERQDMGAPIRCSGITVYHNTNREKHQTCKEDSNWKSQNQQFKARIGLIS